MFLSISCGLGLWTQATLLVLTHENSNAWVLAPFFFFQIKDNFGIDILKLTDANDVSNISHRSRASGQSETSNLDMHTRKINSSVKVLWSRSLLSLLHCTDSQEDTLIMKYKADTAWRHREEPRAGQVLQ